MIFENRAQLDAALSKDEVISVLCYLDAFLAVENIEDFNRLLHNYAKFVGFEYVLYAFVKERYDKILDVTICNISNPIGWMEEYAQEGFIDHDPLRFAMERRFSRGEKRGIIVWNRDEDPQHPLEKKIVERRSSFGLRHGLSAFCDSSNYRAAFMVSLASRAVLPDERSKTLALSLVQVLNRVRKRLELLSRVQQLTERERHVADWLVQGKSNWDIAEILCISPSTVKYHVANILKKLDVGSRQQASSVIVAAETLG